MKLNWFKLVQICLDLDQLAKKCIFLVKNGLRCGSPWIAHQAC